MDFKKKYININTCQICNAKITATHYPYNDTGWTDYNIFDGLKILHCSNCGFGFSAPELDAKTVNNFYKNQYRSADSAFHINYKKLKHYHGVKDIRNSRAFGQLSLARAFCNFTNTDILLDIGAGKGGSFKVAKTIFKKPSLHAIELAKGAKEFFKNKLGVESHNSINDFTKLGLKAKIILMSHSLEHVRISDLSELLSHLSSALDKNGVAVIEVPHVDLRLHWKNRGVDTPHFLFFSLDSLIKLFENYSFQILFIDTCGPYYQSDEKFSITEKKSQYFKSVLKKSFNKLPMLVKVSLRNILRSFEQIKNFKQIYKINTLYSLPQLSYGGNRVCVRLVVKINK